MTRTNSAQGTNPPTSFTEIGQDHGLVCGALLSFPTLSRPERRRSRLEESKAVNNRTREPSDGKHTARHAPLHRYRVMITLIHRIFAAFLLLITAVFLRFHGFSTAIKSHCHAQSRSKHTYGVELVVRSSPFHLSCFSSFQLLSNLSQYLDSCPFGWASSWETRSERDFSAPD